MIAHAGKVARINNMKAFSFIVDFELKINSC